MSTLQKSNFIIGISIGPSRTIYDAQVLLKHVRSFKADIFVKTKPIIESIRKEVILIENAALQRARVKDQSEGEFLRQLREVIALKNPEMFAFFYELESGILRTQDLLVYHAAGYENPEDLTDLMQFRGLAFTNRLNSKIVSGLERMVGESGQLFPDRFNESKEVRLILRCGRENRDLNERIRRAGFRVEFFNGWG